MEERISRVFDEMLRFDMGDAHRIQHFTKVHAFARQIALRERFEETAREVLEVAALTHDIGIRPALEKYKSAAGHLQEQEGPPRAADMLARLGFAQPLIDRVCYLIAHHHTYEGIDGADYQILVEADFLVNIHEAALSPEAIRHTYDTIFKTQAGRAMCRLMFGLTEKAEE